MRDLQVNSTLASERCVCFGVHTDSDDDDDRFYFEFPKILTLNSRASVRTSEQAKQEGEQKIKQQKHTKYGEKIRFIRVPTAMWW